jgi:hypothetical protein
MLVTTCKFKNEKNNFYWNIEISNFKGPMKIKGSKGFGLAQNKNEIFKKEFSFLWT